ncbi:MULTISPECIES: hypothetical protein [unclassified Streptomyces]|uniref:hypothetical protein n=1 Tax=unclassified Streptomyces TaxID=2593676 RepID=UPI002DDB8515|nr:MULTISPECIES: hypothetical protein [unclassified Streptomyces]WSC35535.1 hypothetical protein OHA08_08510 [Streptomyces sp. NBC_01763]WSF88263.1 hypothetical protein OIE70_37180 [Streptomyces sp. NBC_01744]WSG79662.1 hypothetical protein OIE76_06820 [Streptomyces sp. NBC_01727]
MLNAAEAAMDAAAEDDAERQRNRAKLYAPPGGRRRTPAERQVRPPGAGLDMARAQSLAAQLAAEDAKLTGGRTG